MVNYIARWGDCLEKVIWKSHRRNWKEWKTYDQMDWIKVTQSRMPHSLSNHQRVWYYWTCMLSVMEGFEPNQTKPNHNMFLTLKLCSIFVSEHDCQLFMYLYDLPSCSFARTSMPWPTRWRPYQPDWGSTHHMSMYRECSKDMLR